MQFFQFFTATKTCPSNHNNVGWSRNIQKVKTLLSKRGIKVCKNKYIFPAPQLKKHYTMVGQKYFKGSGGKRAFGGQNYTKYKITIQ